MSRYKNDQNRELSTDTNIIIPHGGDDAEASSTVTRLEFKQGDTVRFVKVQPRKVLKALGLDRVSQSRYIKQAFNNFKDM